MNTKGMKFLAVLAVLAMAFASVAVFTAEDFDAATEQEFDVTAYTGDIELIGEGQMSVGEGDTIKVTITPGSSYKMFGSVVVYVSEKSEPTAGYMTILEYTTDYAYVVAEDNASSTLTINATGAAKAADKYLYVYQGVIDSTWTVKSALPDADEETGIINLEDKTAYTVTLTDNFATKVLLSGSNSAALNFVGESTVVTTSTGSYQGLIQNAGSGQLIITGYGKISATSGAADRPIISGTGSGLTKICGTELTLNNSPTVYGSKVEVHDGAKICSTRGASNARAAQDVKIIGGELSATYNNAQSIYHNCVVGSMDSFEIPVLKTVGNSAGLSGSSFVKLETDNLRIYSVATGYAGLKTIVYDGTGATSLRTDAGLIEIFNGTNNLSVADVEEIGSTIIIHAGSLTVGSVLVSGIIELGEGTTFTGGDVTVTGTLVSKGTATATSLTLGPEAVVGGIDVTALILPAGATFVAGGMAAVASEESVITYVSESNTLTLTHGSLSISAFDESEDGNLNVSVIDGDIAFNGITMSLKGTAGEEASYALVLSYSASTGAATTAISDVAEDIEINASNGKAFNLAGIIFTSNKVDSVLAVDIVTDNEISESYEVKSGKFTLASTSLENTNLIVDNGATVAVGTAEYSVASGDPMTLTLSSSGTITAVMKEGSMSVSIPKNGTFEYDNMKFTAKNKAATVQVLAVEQEEPAWDVVAYSGELNFTTETNGDYPVAITENSALTVGDSTIEYTNTTVSINFDGTKYTVSPAGEDPIDVVYVYEGGDTEVAIPDTLPITITAAVDEEEVKLPFTLSYTKALIGQDVVYDDITIVSGIANVAYNAADTEVSADADAIIQIGTAPTTKEYLAAGAGATFVLTEDGLNLVNGSIMINENVGAQLDTYGGTTITIEQNDSIIIVMAYTPEPTEEVPAPETSYIFAVAQGKVSFANDNGYDAIACGGIVSAPGFDIAADDEKSSVAVNVGADGKVTIVSGDAVIDLTALEYTIGITEGVTAISGDNHIYAEADSTLVFTKNGEDVMIAVGSGKVQATVESGFQISLNNLVYTVADDAVFTVDLTVDGVKAVDLVSGTLDVYGTMTTADSLTVTGGSVQITKTLTIADGVDYTVNSTIVYADENSKIVLQRGAQVNATISAVNAEGITASVTVQGLMAGTAGVEIYPGSVIITGTVASNGTITANTLDVVLKDLIIPNGVTLTVADEASVVLDNVEIQEGGELIIGGTASGDVVNNGKLTINKDADTGDLDIEGTGEIVDKRKNTMEDQEVSGDATKSHVYPSNQRIIVRGSWTILKGADVTIKGELVIPDGAKLTVENGATLSVTKANAEISGTLVIDAGDDKTIDGMFTCERGNVNVYGTVLSNGFFIVNGSSQGGNVTIYEGASFTVGTDGNLTISEGGKVVVEDKATLTIQGESNANAVYNYGTVVFDTKVAATGSSTIYQMGNGAVVDVKNYSIGYAASLEEQSTLTVIDSRLIFTVDKSEGKDIGYTYYFVSDGTYATDHVKPVTGLQDISEPNSIVISTSKVDPYYISTISGLKITEKVSSKDSDDASADHYGKGKIWTNTMDVSGDVKKSSEYVGEATGTSKNYEYKMVLDGQRAATVADKLKYPAGITMTVSGDLTVSGELDASAGSSSSGAVLTNSGTITVTGDGIIKSRDLDPVVNASKTLVDSSNKVWHFMTIDKMIAACNADGSKITEFEAVGDNYVTKTASIPAPVKMTITGNVYIGSEESDIETMLTVKDGTQITGSGTITVYGTLYAENATNVKNNMDIISDIKTIQVDEKGKVVKTGWAKWTNLTLALNTAVAGDEIRVTKETGEVWLRSSAEVKEGVTLIIDEDAVPLVLANGVTLTVNGVFIAEQEVYAQSMFDVTAKNENATTAGSRTSAIVVNGEMLSGAKYAKNSFVPTTEGFNSEAKLSAGAPIAGAYFTTDDGNVIAGIETAFWMVDEMTGNMKINGAVTTTDAIFAATEECSKIIIGKDLNTTIPTKFTFGTIALLGATIAGESDGSVDGTIAVGDAKVVLKDVTGKFAAEDREGKLVLTDTYTIETKGKLQVSAGDVYAATTATSLNVTGSGASIASGAKLIANGADATFASLKVDGTLLVPVNKAFKATDLTVAGDVVVEPATATASKGNLSVTNMYVGMSKSDVTSASASVSGPFAFTGYVLVHNSATLDKAAQDIVDATKNTKYYVEGKLWFTAYGTTTLNVKYAPISDAKLESWNSKFDFTGTTVKLTDSPAIGTYQTLYAKINYEIYSVTIKTDAGIKEVSIDGKLMVSPASGENQFTLNKLRAGTHKVTYTLMNGYEGTAQLSTKDGTILQNNSFTLSGTDDDDLSVLYQLSGTEKQVEPEPVTPEEKSEWTITTILLCVLVVLIAIMAVIVALRLMRN